MSSQFPSVTSFRLSRFAEIGSVVKQNKPIKKPICERCFVCLGKENIAEPELLLTGRHAIFESSRSHFRCAPERQVSWAGFCLFVCFYSVDVKGAFSRQTFQLFCSWNFSKAICRVCKIKSLLYSMLNYSYSTR